LKSFLGFIIICNLERYEEAVRASEEAFALDANDTKAWNNVGLALAKLERKSYCMPKGALRLLIY
jgi:Flp pilus assembly protein TadD